MEPTPQTESAPVTPVSPTPQVTSASTTQLAKKNKSVLLIVVIIGIVAFVMIACCAIAASVLFVARNRYETNRQIDYNYITPTDDITETELPTPDTSELGKVNTTAYTFYYPKTFVQTNTPNTLQSYQSTKVNSLGLYNTIKLNVTEMPEGSGDIPECNAYANQLTTIAFSDLTSKGKTVTAMSGSSVDRNDMIGCDMKFQVSDSKSSYLTEITMIYKSEDTKLYVIGVSYDSKNSSEYQALQDAKNAFVIK